MEEVRQQSQDSHERDEAEVQELLQKVLTETLLYRPERPLEFMVQHLDELCDGPVAPLTSSFRRLVAAQRSPDQFLDECASVYAAMAAGSPRAPYCGRADAARLAKACAVDLPKHRSHQLVEQVETSCDDAPLDFERFAAVARVCVDCRGVARDARDAWHLLAPGRPDAEIDREDLLRILPASTDSAPRTLRDALPADKARLTVDDVLERSIENVTDDVARLQDGSSDVGTYDSFLARPLQSDVQYCF